MFQNSSKNPPSFFHWSSIWIYPKENAFKLYYVYSECVWVAQSCLDSLWLHGLGPTRLLLSWDFPGGNIGVSCHSLHQGSQRVGHDWETFTFKFVQGFFFFFCFKKQERLFKIVEVGTYHMDRLFIQKNFLLKTKLEQGLK